jgi:hypothetical protein
MVSREVTIEELVDARFYRLVQWKAPYSAQLAESQMADIHDYPIHLDKVHSLLEFYLLPTKKIPSSRIDLRVLNFRKASHA